MEGSVSNVEVCNLAYTGQFEKLKECILLDKSLACKIDQVRLHFLFNFDRLKVTFSHVFAIVLTHNSL